MGSMDNYSEIFEFEDIWGNKLFLSSEDTYTKKRILGIDGDEFVINKTLAKKIVKELIEEFKLEFINLKEKRK